MYDLHLIRKKLIRFGSPLRASGEEEAHAKEAECHQQKAR